MVTLPGNVPVILKKRFPHPLGVNELSHLLKLEELCNRPKEALLGGRGYHS